MNHTITFFTSFILFIGLISCSDSANNHEVEEGDIFTSTLMDTCDCNELKLDSSGIYLNSENKAYTGICVGNYPETSDKYVEKSILEGKLHGSVTYFDKSGNVLIEEVYENGKAKRTGTADIIVCNCNELVQMNNADPRLPNRFKLDDIPFTGTCKSFHADSVTVSMEANYKEGFLDGLTTYYNKSGERLYQEKYAQGVLEKIIN